MKRPVPSAGWRVGAIASVLPLVGCFSYLPVEPRAVPEGSHVRVEMTRLGFAALPEIPGQSGPRLAGRVTGHDDQQLFLSVPVGDLLDGSRLGRELEIPTRDVVSIEVRELSRVRTGILVAGGLAAGLALYLSFDKGTPMTERDVEDQEIEGSLWSAALFSIPFR